MENPINWQALAQQLGTLRPSGERGGDEPARHALDLIIGEEQLRAAVDHYLAHRPGFELVRSVLRVLHSWVAARYCYEVYQSPANIETRRTSVELLRFIADSRALVWVEEFLADEDVEIQGWGLTLVDQLLFSGRAFPEECLPLLDIAEQHSNLYIREHATAMKLHLQTPRKQEPQALPLLSATPSPQETETPPVNGHVTTPVQRSGGADSHSSRSYGMAAHKQNGKPLIPEIVTPATPRVPVLLTTVASEVTVESLTPPEPLDQGPLLDAIARRDALAVTAFLTNIPAHGGAEERALLDPTALRIAVEVGDAVIVRALLEHNVPIDIPDPRGYTPLLAAADKGASEIVQLLLEAHVAVNMKSSNGDTALMLAAAGGHAEVAGILLEKGAAVSARNRFGRTAFMMAACSGNVALVDAFLKRGVAINTQDWHGRSALIDALSNGYEEVAVLLLKHGAAVNAQDSFKQTPLFLAVEKGYLSIVQILLDKSVALDIQDESGRTPLFVAVENNHVDVVKLLLDAGANPQIHDSEGRTIRMLAEELGNTAVLNLLDK